MRYILKNYVHDALHSIWSNKLRSFLSVLGIVIGIVSVTVFLSIGKGAELEMKKYLDKYATKSLNIYSTQGGGWGDYGKKGPTVPKKSMVLNDDVIYYLKDNAHGVKAILPETSSNKRISYGVKKSQYSTVMGVEEDYFKVYSDKKIAYGRNISKKDNEKKEKVVVLNYKMYDTLFGKGIALGKYVKIGEIPFLVVGVLEQSEGEKQNMKHTAKVVYIPQKVLQESFLGKYSYTTVTVYVEDDINMKLLSYELQFLLMKKSGAEMKEALPFDIYDASKFQKEQENFAMKAKLILMGIGGISLLVGGIGVMNIMLVSVTERTREIGIRKAIGAKKFHIIGQFLTESIFVSIFGAVIALGASYGIIALLKSFKIPAVLTSDVAILACSFAIGVGIIFGILPAWKAAKLKPIDALRFE